MSLASPSAGAATGPAPGASLKVWFQASRPKTLTAAIVPVAVGTGVALADGVVHWGAAAVALLGALLIQIGTNLANDYYDFRKGADTSERLGPARVTQQGLIAPSRVLRAAIACFALAVLVGMYLVARVGWPILAVGLISVVAGYAYTGGPFPLAYNGLGDLFVLVFFGFVAVSGTYFVQADALSSLAVIAGLPVGALGVALLAVNNLRDRPTDEKAGKRTLVVRFGDGAAKAEYVSMLVAAYAVPLGLWLAGGRSGWMLLPLASLPFAVPPLRKVFREKGAILNLALAETARLQLVFGLSFAVALWRTGR